MSVEQSLEAALAEREMARRNYMLYMIYVFKYIYEKELIRNWHQDLIAQVLESVYAGRLKKVLISVAPSYGKTEQVVRCFSSWCMGKNPRLKFIYTTYGGDLSTATSVETRDIVQHPAYKNLFPDTAINPAANQKHDWKLKKGARFFATSTGAAITGIHANIILIDDILKALDAYSNSALEEAYLFYKNSILSRREKDAAIVIIMQRLNQKDLVGRLLEDEGDQWLHITLPALNEEAIVYEYGSFRYERKEMEPLFMLRHNYDELMILKREMQEQFDIQMQQDPEIKNAGYWVEENFPFIGDFDIPEQNLYICVDPAVSESERADDRAIVVEGWSINEEEIENIVIMDVEHGKWEVHDFADKMIYWMRSYPSAPLLIENMGGGIVAHRVLERRIAMRNAQLRSKGEDLIKNEIIVFKVDNKVSKNQKIMEMKPYTNLIQIKLRSNGRGMDQFLKEAKAFDPSKKHNTDNVIDAASTPFSQPECVAKKVNSSDHYAGVKKPSKKRKKKSWNI